MRIPVTSTLLGLAAALALTTLTACGGSDGSSTTTRPAGTADDATTLPETVPATDDLPAPDPTSFVGVNQVVNLVVLPDGSTPTLDIWALRTFTNGPVLLAEGLEYGQVSAPFGSPPDAVLASVISGAGPDGEQFSGLFSADAEQRYTSVIVFDRDAAVGTGLLLEDTDPANPYAFPEALPGQALVQLYAYQLTLHPLGTGESFEYQLAGVDPSFQVGIEGTPGCAPQPRQTDQGYTPMVLGGTQRVPFDVPAGSTTFTFHGWGTNNQDCTDASVIDPVTVTLEAGERVWVLLHSRDGQTIESLVVPVA
jgi:hypothetical protein